MAHKAALMGPPAAARIPEAREFIIDAPLLLRSTSKKLFSLLANPLAASAARLAPLRTALASSARPDPTVDLALSVPLLNFGAGLNLFAELFSFGMKLPAKFNIPPNPPVTTFMLAFIAILNGLGSVLGSFAVTLSIAFIPLEKAFFISFSILPNVPRMRL